MYKEKLLNIFSYLFGILMIFVFVVSTTLSFHYKYFNTNILYNLPFSILFTVAIFLFLKKAKHFKPKTLIKIAIINFTLLLLLQCFFGFVFRVTPSWDFNMIYSSAKKLAEGTLTHLTDYYSFRYPNNIGITVFLSLVYKVFMFFKIDLIFGSIVLNILSIFISCLLTFFLIKRLFGLRTASCSSFLFILITPFYTYSPIFYTDTLTMIFPIASFLLLHIYLKSTWKYKPLHLPFIGILLAIGIDFKTNIVISLIAICIFLILYLKGFKKVFIAMLFLLLPFLISSFIGTSINQRYITTPMKDAGFPATHWIMMGLSGNGGFNAYDVPLSEKGKTKENIKKINIIEIKKRIKNHGKNLPMFFLNKLAYTWGDGTYYANVKLERHPVYNTPFHKFIIGEKNFFYVFFSCITHFSMLLLIALGSFRLFKSKEKFPCIFNITILGTLLFLLLWEARSRYLVCILPLMIASCSVGINYILEKNLNFKEIFSIRK